MANSTIRKNFKFRIYPNIAQIVRLENTLDLCRDLYNAAIQERRDAWRLNRVSISFFDQSKQLKDIRRQCPEYKKIQFRVCDQTLRHVDKTFRAFFRRCKAGEKPGFPRFKSKRFFNSFFYNRVGFQFLGNKLHLADIGWLKIRLHREITGTIKQITVKRDGLKWYAHVSCDQVPVTLLPACNKSTGIDVGIESFATLSDGTQIKNGRYYELAQKKLRVAQRRVSRRRKGSKRRRKAVMMLRDVHRKIFNKRHDFQHKLSTNLIREYDLIAVEKLNVKGLSKGIRAKQLNDVAWSSFFQKLTYKAESAGRKLIEVNPAYTSQDCSYCGYREQKPLSVRKHNCQSCGLILHRDHNAALNILAAGLAVQDVTYRVADSVS